MEITQNLTKLMKFIQEIVISFGDLNDNLEDIIFNKLSSKEFNDKPFEVLEIKDFKIIEMIVGNNSTVICKIEVTGLCNNPEIGEIIKIYDNYKITNNILLYINNKIQIVTNLIKKNNDGIYMIKIISKKIITDNIICVSEQII